MNLESSNKKISKLTGDSFPCRGRQVISFLLGQFKNLLLGSEIRN